MNRLDLRRCSIPYFALTKRSKRWTYLYYNIIPCWLNHNKRGLLNSRWAKNSVFLWKKSEWLLHLSAIMFHCFKFNIFLEVVNLCLDLPPKIQRRISFTLTDIATKYVLKYLATTAIDRETFMFTTIHLVSDFKRNININLVTRTNR